ncbi:PREDICTED: probable methyltransferase TARBP1 [Priapulus caudatus]|uniref:Probable methyltransferase TARBP1 n=1 Tax=Priapulus caudatus TaxID=37621 RepID=A0ABM1EFP3_PRICU|nr:PREDICTED: probable methyltransferase TARBP1 [Priapulus caudatus]
MQRDVHRRENTRTSLREFRRAPCKQRAWQVALLLEPTFDLGEEEGSRSEVLGVGCWGALVKDKQPSVRCMIEWVATRLLYRHPECCCEMWSAIKDNSEQRTGSICSLFAICTHLCKLYEGRRLEEFMESMLVEILPWTMMQHFSVRTYAQVALCTVWTVARQQNMLDFCERHALLEGCFNQVATVESNSTKSVKKLMESFWFSDFHPIADYSIEVIFYILPWLCLLAQDEWIHPDLFADINGLTWLRGNHSGDLQLYSPDSKLRTAKPGDWRTKLGEGARASEPVSVSDLEGNVQKKLIPWRSLMPDHTEADVTYKRQSGAQGGLVLVASLIDKPTNLGGLCRTCEIFGVSEYVVGNMKYVEDPRFKSLSVTAEKWIPITEVRVHELEAFLQRMRREGYALVGAEQTASSTSLCDFSFPAKTLVLLGNEKEGIPVKLIQLLDACVEVPQWGVVRSLNVHVSGALFVWEYTRQHPPVTTTTG